MEENNRKSLSLEDIPGPKDTSISASIEKDENGDKGKISVSKDIGSPGNKAKATLGAESDKTTGMVTSDGSMELSVEVNGKEVSRQSRRNPT